MGPPTKKRMSTQTNKAIASKPLEDINEDDIISQKELIIILKDMQKSLSFLSDGYDDYKRQLINLEKENVALKEENKILNKRLSQIETDYYNSQQNLLQKTITIHGLSKEKNENIKKVIIDAGKVLNVEIKESNIISYRTMNNKTPRPIIIAEFDSLELKQTIRTNF